MASVYLDLVPPNDIPDLTTLHIYEAVAFDGPFAEIEVVTPVGDQGSYLSEYTTELAASIDNWFSVQWEDANGALTEMSEAIQGSAASVIMQIVERVKLRLPSVNEQIAYQEAQAVVEEIMGVTNPDPSTITYKKISGMTLFTLARILISDISFSAGGESWTAGLVSMKASTTAAKHDPDALLVIAARMLGISTSRIVQMCPPEIAGGLSQIVSADISRLQIEVE
jgi:hypothetical protein